MFLKSCPRDLTEIQMRVSGEEAVELFSKTQLIAQLEGYPLLIRKVAGQVRHVENLVTSIDDFMKQTIPKCKKECFGSGSAATLGVKLAEYFLSAGLPEDMRFLLGDDAAAFVWTYSLITQARNGQPRPEHIVSLPPDSAWLLAPCALPPACMPLWPLMRTLLWMIAPQTTSSCCTGTTPSCARTCS